MEAYNYISYRGPLCVLHHKMCYFTTYAWNFGYIIYKMEVLMIFDVLALFEVGNEEEALRRISSTFKELVE